MALVAIQGLQLGLLLEDGQGETQMEGGDGEEGREHPAAMHPFAVDLYQMERCPQDVYHLFVCMDNPEMAEKTLPAPELIAVILLFFTCFVHLSSPVFNERLRPELVQKMWAYKAVGNLQGFVSRRAAQAHLAEMVATLLLDDEAAAVVAEDTHTHPPTHTHRRATNRRRRRNRRDSGSMDSVRVSCRLASGR
jgi:hypothetical protein